MGKFYLRADSNSYHKHLAGYDAVHVPATNAAPGRLLTNTTATGPATAGLWDRWTSPKLKAGTISGTFTWRLWAQQDADANAALLWRILLYTRAGATQILVDLGNQGAGELPTTAGVYQGSATLPEYVCTGGEQLVFECFIDDAADQGGTGNRIGGIGLRLWDDGAVGGQGEAWMDVPGAEAHPIQYVRQYANTQNKTSATTIVAPGQTLGCPVGDLLVARVAAVDNPTVNSVTDTKGNTWTRAVSTPTVEIWATKVTNALVNGDNVTVTFAAENVDDVLVIDHFSGADNIVDASGVGYHFPGGVGVDYADLTTVTENDLVIAAAAVNGPHADAYTEDAEFAALPRLGTTGGSAASNTTNAGAYKLVTTPALYEWNPTIARDGRWVIAAFKATPNPLNQSRTDALGITDSQSQELVLGPLDPATLSNMFVRLQPTSLPAAGSTPDTWPDTSGTGRTIFQNDAPERPIVRSPRLNGYKSAEFDQTDDSFQDTTGTAVSQPITTFQVFRVPDTSSWAVFGAGLYFYGNDMTPRMYPGDAAIGPALVPGRWYAFGTRFNGTSALGRRADTLDAYTGDTGSAQWVANTWIGSSGDRFGLELTEFIGYSASLTDDQIKRVLEWLSERYWYETWAKADGSAWPSRWTTAVGSTSIVDVQGHEGRMVAQGANFTYARALASNEARADGDVLFRVRWADNTEQYTTVNLRFNGGWSAGEHPMNAYQVLFYRGALTGDGFRLRRYNAGTTTSMAQTDGPSTVTGAVWCRFEVTGSTIRAKWWDEGTAEPTAWLLSVTDTSITAAGVCALTHVNAGAPTARTAWFDELSGSVFAPPVVSVEFTDALGALDTRTQAATSARTATDALGLTDTVVATYGRTVTDPLGLTDSVSQVATHQPTVTDALGALDVRTQAATYVFTRTDTLQILDSVSQVGTLNDTRTDTVSSLDSQTVASTMARGPPDEALGILDASTKSIGTTVQRPLTQVGTF